MNSEHKQQQQQIENPSNVTHCDGDLTEFHRAEFIIQQSNCTSRRGLGLYRSLSDRYPSTDVYRWRRNGKSEPGTITATPTGEPEGSFPQHVIHMFSQFYPGKPRSATRDNAKQRLKWFSQCLNSFVEHWLSPSSSPQGDSSDDSSPSTTTTTTTTTTTKRNITVAFPEKIGCGLAGGNWDEYRNLLYRFAENNPEIQVYIVRKRGTTCSY